MAELEDSETQNLSFQGSKEARTDKDVGVFDTIIINDSIEATQAKLKALQSQGIDPHGMFSSFFFYFSVEQNPSCPEFISWCIENYSQSKGMIMNASRSRILCPINSLNIRSTLSIPSEFIQLSNEYNEGEILRFFQEYSYE